MFVENVLGAASRVKILRTLVEIPAGFTLSELEKESGLSRGIVHKEVRRLVRQEIVAETESKGKLKVYRINVNHPCNNQIVGLFSKEKLTYRRNVVILAVWNILETAISVMVDNDKKSNIFLIKLFGSHARGTAAITSDIDLLVVMHEKNGNEETRILEICEKYGKKAGAKINPVFMTSKRYAEEFNRKTAFLEQVGRSNIDLY
jgi:predicted nucleotidyltransferase